MLHAQEVLDETEASNDAENDEQVDGIMVPAHIRKRAKKRQFPTDPPRCDVIYDLSDEQKQCSCGLSMSQIGVESRLTMIRCGEQGGFIMQWLPGNYPRI